MLRFELLQAPREDGDVLIEPPASCWPEQIDRYIRTRTIEQSALRLAGIPVQMVRQQTRDRLFGAGTTEPVVACGHQPEFIHPGVWAKCVVVRHVANSLGMHGVDLVVDNDTPRLTTLAVPSLTLGVLTQRHSIPVFTGTAGAAYEGRPPLGPSAIEHICREAEENLSAVLSFSTSGGLPQPESLIGEYCHGLGRAERPIDFVEQHLAGRDQVDRAFAANLQELRVSRAFDGVFVADILINLDRFARTYNDSLAEYRRDQHVRSPDRPLPDLKSTGDRMEAPFWIYQPHQHRSRLWVAVRGDSLDIFADHRFAGSLSRADLLQNATATLASLAPWVIRPRALTLTLWARLLACDLFVHGIGGAKYDRVTDGIFRRYYGCEPPPYACVTATLRMPLPRYRVTKADLAAAVYRARDVHFNPQRYVTSTPADLIADRERWIAESNWLREGNAGPPGRRTVFHLIRGINAAFGVLDPDTSDRLEAELEQVRRQSASNAVADSREFFYALQPRSRLEMLAERLIEATGIARTASTY
jgi:hypothetical protein